MAAWVKRGSLMGPRGESVLSVGPSAPSPARDGDVWLVTGGVGGPVAGAAVWRDDALWPSSATTPSTSTLPHGTGWNVAGI